MESKTPVKRSPKKASVAKKTSKKATKNDKIIVIGASAGGLEALISIVKQLPEDFPIPILVVKHISAETDGSILLDALNTAGRLSFVHASNGEYIQAGRVYMPPSDHHLMIAEKGKLSVTKGAQENRSRPGIDPLFRSAAIHYGQGAIGVILSGLLDDGTAGMIAIQRCGGVCIIQDPNDAAYPDMPKNALNQLKPDYCVTTDEMGGILSTLVGKKIGKPKAIPKDLQLEATIAQRVLSDLPSVNALGEQVPFNCPGCGGILWRVEHGKGLRYRCHTGHAYTAAILLAEQTKKIEETMWTALRMFEERRNLLTTMAKEKVGSHAKSVQERADASQVHIDRIRAILLADDTLTRKKPDSK